MTDRKPLPIAPERLEQLMDVIRGLARRYARTGIDAEDLAGWGFLKLAKLIDRYTPERDATFDTFAIHASKCAMFTALRDDFHLIRVSSDVENAACSIAKGRSSEADYDDRMRSRLSRAEYARRRPVTFGSMEGDPTDFLCPVEDRGQEEADARMDAEVILAGMEPRDASLLRTRYGIGCREKPWRDAGSEHGMAVGAAHMAASRAIAATRERMCIPISEREPTEDEKMSMIRELRGRGLSFAKIADEMNRRGVPSLRGGTWYQSVVCKLLTREAA